MLPDGWKVVESKSFIIPNLPPSVNSIYQIIFHQRRVEMKPDVRRWKTEAKEYIQRLTPLGESYLFNVRADFYYNFFYKNGKVKKFDTQNMMKVLCDAVAEKCGFDDSLIKFGSWSSLHEVENEHVEVSLEQVTLAPTTHL
jgi:Holliday junction resolvase RusA-like endonuclease